MLQARFPFKNVMSMRPTAVANKQITDKSVITSTLVPAESTALIHP